MKVGRSLPAVGLAGSIVVAGGLTNSHTATTDNEGYSATPNSWKTLAAMPTARQGSCAAGIAGKLYVASGSNADSGSAVSVQEVYNGTTKAWSTLAPVPKAVARRSRWQPAEPD